MNKSTFRHSNYLQGRRGEPPPIFPSFEMLGIRVHAMTARDLVSAVAYAIDNDATYIIANHNFHSLYLWPRAAQMREFYSKARYVHVDGMSLILLGRLLGLPLKAAHRTTYVDLLPMVADEAVKRQWRIFYLGSAPVVAEKAARTLRTLHPGLHIATQSGYFDTSWSGDENQAVLASIRDYTPDILMVGMGMPRQEMWLAENLQFIHAHAVFCCGAMMDYV